jgi:hypothetical protein
MIFEVDSSVLVKHWNEHLTDRSVIRSILDDISELSKNFNSFRICFVRREANQEAHSIAKFGCLHGESVSWGTEPPDFLVHSLEADCIPVLVN